MLPLLNLLWGSDVARRFLLVKRADNPNAFGKYFDTNEEAAQYATQASAKGAEIWMAVSLFNADADTRTQENVYISRALFLDIDCGPDKPYPSHADAEMAVDDFAAKLGLPRPLLINSGRGLHCYWILDTPLPGTLWTRLAYALRAACVENGLAADHSVTIDSARVLRLPDTFNRKYDEPLSVSYYSDPDKVTITPISTLANILQPYDKPEFTILTGNAGDEFKVAYDPIPRSAYLVAEKCPQIGFIRDTRGNVPEPLWYAALGLLAHTEEGRDICHQWSNGHPNYSFEETEKRIDRAINYSATTCAKFEGLNPDLCANCPHKGTITSPIILGRKLDGLTEDQVRFDDERVKLDVLSFEPDNDSTPNVNNESEVQSDEVNTPLDKPANNQHGNGSFLSSGIEREALDAGDEAAKLNPGDVVAGVQRGFPYIIAKQGVFLVVRDEETKQQDFVQLINVPLKVERVVKGRNATEVHLSWQTPTGKQETGIITGQQLADKRKGAEFFTNAALFNVPNVERILKYIQAAAQRIGLTKEPDKMHDNFGWREDDSFVLGSTLIKAEQTTTAYLSQTVPRRMTEGLTLSGSQSEWSRLTAELNHNKWWVHRFVILAAIGTPLLRLMGKSATGAIVSLAGDSGVGKTAVVAFALGAYGSPDALTVAPTSTANTILEMLRTVNNLPLTINEAIGVIPPWQLSDLFYAAANGEAKGRLSRNAQIKEASGWQTVLFLTSNTHVSSLPDSVLNEATRRRVYEVTIDDHNRLDPALCGEMYRCVETNHGHIAQVFARMLTNDPEYYRNRMNELFNGYSKTVEAKNRFGLWLICAAQIVGETLAYHNGPIQFGFQDAIEKAIAHLRLQGTLLDQFSMRIGDTIADYVNDNTGRFTAYNAKSEFWDEATIRGEVAGRYICDDQGRAIALAIHRKKLVEFLLTRNLDASHLDKWIDANPGVEKNKGTRLTRRAMAPIRCVVIPIDERDIVSAPDFTKEVHNNV